MEAIKYSKQNPGAETRKIAEVFDCSKTQVQTILKNQESIAHHYATNAPAIRKNLHGPQYEDVDIATYHWYS